jgi:hypothetical protein
MRGAAWLAVLLVAPFLPANSQTGRQVKFATLQVALGADIAKPAFRVIRSQREWSDFLREHSASLNARQTINFSKQMVVAIFAGLKPTGGFSERVERVVEESPPGKPARGVIHHQIIAPAPDAMLTQVLTYPYVVVRIEKRFDQVELRPPIEASDRSAAPVR